MAISIRYRDSVLINKAYHKLVIPDISTRACSLIVSLVDSLIAARYIGTGAMSAIALITPITLFSSCLHDILASGLAPVVIRYKSRGQNRQAARAFGAISAQAFLGFLIAYGLAIIFAKDILQLFTQDQALITDGLNYFIPTALLYPVCELGLCMERGFKTDGKNGFFGIRAVITNILNIVFSLIAVLGFHGGIIGISIAANLATLAGYCWSFSYIFSKKCTIRPDLSVLRAPREVKRYLQEEMQIGSVYALDDGLDAAASTMLNKAVILTGGTSALAAIGVCNAVVAVAYTVTGAVQQSEYSLSNLFYSDHDHIGTVNALRSAVLIEGVFCLIFWAVLNLFPGLVYTLYKVQDEEVRAALRICLCFTAAAGVADGYTNLFSSYFLATERKKIAAFTTAGHNIAVFCCALTGFLKISFSALLCICMLASILAAAVQAYLIRRGDRRTAGGDGTEKYTCSYTLSDDACADISRVTAERLEEIRMPQRSALRAALLSEECSRLILYTNKGAEDVCVDYRFSVSGKECVITIIDTGVVFDPIHRLQEGELPEEFAMARKILQGFSPKASYTRVVGLNLSHLVIELPEQENA